MLQRLGYAALISIGAGLVCSEARGSAPAIPRRSASRHESFFEAKRSSELRLFEEMTEL